MYIKEVNIAFALYGWYWYVLGVLYTVQYQQEKYGTVYLMYIRSTQVGAVGQLLCPTFPPPQHLRTFALCMRERCTSCYNEPGNNSLCAALHIPQTLRSFVHEG